MDDHPAHRHWAGFLLLTCAIGAMTWTGLSLIGAWFLTVHLLLATVCLMYLWLDRRWTKPHLRHRDLHRIRKTAEHTSTALLVGAFAILATAGGTLIGAYPS